MVLLKGVTVVHCPWHTWHANGYGSHNAGLLSRIKKVIASRLFGKLVINGTFTISDVCLTGILFIANQSKRFLLLYFFFLGLCPSHPRLSLKYRN
jgi:hypothetical protein